MLKGSLTKKIIKRVLTITIAFNLLLTAYISYAIINNHNNTVSKSMENINIASSIMIKSSNGSKKDLLKVINDLNLSYGVDALIIDALGNVVIGNGDFYNKDDSKGELSENDLIIKIDNSISSSNATMISPMYIENKYYGHLIILNDYSSEFNSVTFTIVFIIVAQMLVVIMLLKLVSAYIKKSIEPIEILKQGMIEYGKTSEVYSLDIKTGDEIEDLSESFMRMVNEIDEEKNKSNEFFNNATHELKTPITAIWGYTQALTSKPIEDIKPEFRDRAFDRMGIESKKMLSLIESLLDISRGHVTNKLYDEEVNVFNVISESKKSIEAMFDYVNIVVDCFNDVSIKANNEDLTTIIKNLLDNAAKYSNGNDIKICVYNVDGLQLTVENFIYEIPVDKKERLLEPFIKFNPNIEQNTEKKVSSSGLGLYLCSTLAEANSMSLTYEIIENKIIFKLQKNKEQL